MMDLVIMVIPVLLVIMVTPVILVIMVILVLLVIMVMKILPQIIKAVMNVLLEENLDQMLKNFKIKLIGF